MRILFIGNSHTYFNDMPHLCAELLRAAGKDVEVTMLTRGGETLHGHILSEQTRFNILFGHYDWVILQEATGDFPSKAQYMADVTVLKGWCDENLGRGFMQNRGRAMALLQKEAELQEIVKLVGQDALSPADNLTLESAKMIREDFLQQNAFLENDQYSSFDRQARLLELILRYKDLCDAAIARGADIWKLYAIAARAAIGRAKTVPAESYQDVYAQIEADMEQQIEEVAKEAEAE